MAHSSSRVSGEISVAALATRDFAHRTPPSPMATTWISGVAASISKYFPGDIFVGILGKSHAHTRFLEKQSLFLSVGQDEAVYQLRPAIYYDEQHKLEGQRDRHRRHHHHAEGEQYVGNYEVDGYERQVQ